MKQIFTTENLNTLTVKTLYRLLIKNIRFYPSVNRFDIYKEIKASFRLSKVLDDANKIKIEKKKATLGLAHILMYNEKSKELVTLHYNTRAEYETLNPKDDNFIYF